MTGLMINSVAESQKKKKKQEQTAIEEISDYIYLDIVCINVC